MQTPPSAIRSLVNQLLVQRARLLRCLPPRPDSRPFLGTERMASRFYPNGWTLADLGPEQVRHGASHPADE
jgi:hypothetical protein